MQLTFESLAELQDFVQWVQAARQAAPVMSAAAKVISGPPNIVVKDLPVRSDSDVMAEIDNETPGGRIMVEAETVDKPARKRRTKAELEAARTAETANPTPAESAEVVISSDSKTAEQSVSAATPSDSAPANKGDAAEFIKSRLAERPEVSQVEHLNLARTFIGKHGMEKYNASFPLAGLTPNVMGYSPADCATHAAALDFLSLE